MAEMVLKVDTSDCSAVIGAVSDLADRLSWLHREHFQAEVQQLIDARRVVTFETPVRGAALEVIASAELLDLMRKYEAR